MGREAAQQLTERIRGTLQGAWEDICTAYTRQAWSALGYPSWDAYCHAEFNHQQMIRLDREQRQEIVAEMRGAGMSTRAIGSALGVDHKTVVGHLRTSVGENSPTDCPAASTVTGVDGKRYAASRPPHAEPEQAAIAPANRARLTEWVESDQKVVDARYIHSFQQVVHQATQLGTFDPERLGRILDQDHVNGLDDLEGLVRAFAAKLRKAHSSLRVVQGGRR